MNIRTRALACFVCSLGCLQAEVLVDFSPGSNLEPNDNPYFLTISDLGAALPSVSTTDSSGDLPSLIGSFPSADSDDGSLGLIVEGRSNDTSDFDADTWTGGDPHPVSGNGSGLGLNDSGGVTRVDGGEAIIWTFDLSNLELDANQSLRLCRAALDRSGAELWQRTGTVGNPGAGALIATGSIWEGDIEISDGDSFALTGDGRLDELTLEIFGEPSPDEPFPPQDLTRPNIIFILVDDWAWNGSTTLMDDRIKNSAMPEGMLSMPSLERLAEHGMIFRNAYAPPQCGPSRAAIQTGQTNARNHFTVVSGGTKNRGKLNVQQDRGFPVIAGTTTANIDNGTCIAQYLRQLGYKNAHLGKWHVYTDPGEKGYDLHDGPTSNNEGQTVQRDSNNKHDITTITDPKLMYHITNTGMQFMEEHASTATPFYLQLSHYAVHEGEECLPETLPIFQQFLADKYDWYNRNNEDPNDINYRSDPASYLAMFWELDQTIGQVIDKTKALGIANNTYIVVMSDNGYKHGFYADITGTDFDQPLFAGKWWVWQGGIRVPMFAMGPGIPAGTHTTVNVTAYDLLPTFVDWAGGDPESIPDIDGRSLKSLMEGVPPTQEFINRPLYFHYPHTRTSIPHSSIIRGNNKVVYFYDAPVLFPDEESHIMLFDLAADPGENENIYPQNPELGEQLFNEMMAYFEAVDARVPVINNEAIYNTYFAENNLGSDDVLPDDWVFYDEDPQFYVTTDEGKKYAQSMNSGFFTGKRSETYRSFTDYWLESFNTDSVDIGDLNSDYDGDGITNLAEYAFGLNPTRIDPPLSPVKISIANGQARADLKLRNDDSSIQYVVKTSEDLVEWTDTGYTIDEIVSDGTELDEYRLLLDAEGQQQFIRVEVRSEN